MAFFVRPGGGQRNKDVPVSDVRAGYARSARPPKSPQNEAENGSCIFAQQKSKDSAQQKSKDSAQQKSKDSA
jgi:hypothetical protein